MARNPFLEIFDNPAPDIPGTFWATVTSISPLRVKRDAEPVLPVTPQTLENLEVGDRVLCLWERRQVIVLGRMSGPSQNTIFVNGTGYRATGHQVAPSYTWSGDIGGVYYANLSVTIPYTPPEGWTFQWSIGEIDFGWLFLTNSERYPSGGKQGLKLIQINNPTTGLLKRVNWQLVTG